MFLFIIMAKPKPENTEFSGTGGAYVKAYIDYKDEIGAEFLAKHYIREMGWQVEETDKVTWLTEKEAKKKDDIYKSFLVARNSGRSLVFHIWPSDYQEKIETFGK